MLSLPSQQWTLDWSITATVVQSFITIKRLINATKFSSAFDFRVRLQVQTTNKTSATRRAFFRIGGVDYSGTKVLPNFTWHDIIIQGGMTCNESVITKYSTSAPDKLYRIPFIHYLNWTDAVTVAGENRTSIVEFTAIVENGEEWNDDYDGDWQKNGEYWVRRS